MLLAEFRQYCLDKKYNVVGAVNYNSRPTLKHYWNPKFGDTFYAITADLGIREEKWMGYYSVKRLAYNVFQKPDHATVIIESIKRLAQRFRKQIPEWIPKDEEKCYGIGDDLGAYIIMSYYKPWHEEAFKQGLIFKHEIDYGLFRNLVERLTEKCLKLSRS